MDNPLICESEILRSFLSTNYVPSDNKKVVLDDINETKKPSSIRKASTFVKIIGSKFKGNSRRQSSQSNASTSGDFQPLSLPEVVDKCTSNVSDTSDDYLNFQGNSEEDEEDEENEGVQLEMTTAYTSLGKIAEPVPNSYWKFSNLMIYIWHGSSEMHHL